MRVSRWYDSATAALFSAAVTLLGNSAFACAPEGAPRLALSVTPGELLGPARVLRVEAYSNNCVRVERPNHWREPGVYSAAADATVERWVGQARAGQMLAEADVGKMQLDIGALQSARGEVFSVQDADVYELRWLDASGKPGELRVAALFQYAERYPEVAGIEQLAEIVRALQAQAERTDLIPMGAQP